MRIGAAGSLFLLGFLGCSSAHELRPAATRARAPELPDVSARDRNHDRLDDDFDESRDEPLTLEVILNRPPSDEDLEQFGRLGGHVAHVFRAVSYGWSGTLPRARLHALPTELGAALHFVAAPREVIPLLDEATRTGRVRPVWAAEFAGLANGVSGDASTTIGIIDTGFDASHPDLAGRMAGFHDYTADAAVEPRDVRGHGTHVTSIAVGSGAAFGLGPGTLHYTNSGDLLAFPAGSYNAAPIHTPAYFGTNAALSVVSSAIWSGGGDATLRAQTSNDGQAWTRLVSVAGPSPRALAASEPAGEHSRYTDALIQNSTESIAGFAVVNAVASYPAVGDGFNALRGVAPGCRWFGAKVFSDLGAGNSTITGTAIDDLVSRRVALGLKVINLSLGTAGTSDVVLRAKVNSAVELGVVVVAAAGNIGPSNEVSDPGRARAAITVGASNDLNELTSYTSIGFENPDPSEDLKPDLLAPGGSSYRSMILAADSNTADGRTPGFADQQADDYTSQQGTSMASPFVAGAVALLIDAWQRQGEPWDFQSGVDARAMKMLLLASATETNRAREATSGADPSLGRSSAPKDRFEGFGLLNPDAGVEAIALALPERFSGELSALPPARLEWERRAWGRHVELHPGDTLKLALTPSGDLDADLYLVSSTPDVAGNPVLLAAGNMIAFEALRDETAYVFVKRVAGSGSFTLDARHEHAVLGGAGSGAAGMAGEPAIEPIAGRAGASDGGAGHGGSPEMGGNPAVHDAGEAGSVPVTTERALESSGCGCALPGAGDRTGSWWVVAALFALLRTRRRTD